MTEETKHKDTCQNRLLVASAVLTFLYYAGATFDGLSVAGATVKFTNQNAVAEFTWFIWLYYYFRTYQYYREAGLNAYRAALNRAYVSNFGPHLLHLPRHQFAMLPDDDAIKSSKIRLAIGRMIEPVSPTNPGPLAKIAILAFASTEKPSPENQLASKKSQVSYSPPHLGHPADLKADL